MSNPQTPRAILESISEGEGTIGEALSQLQLWIGSFKKEIHEVPVNFAVLSHEEMADVLHKRSKAIGNNKLIQTLIDEMKEKAL